MNDEVSAQDASKTRALIEELRKPSPEKTLIQYDSVRSDDGNWHFGRTKVRINVVGCTASDKPTVPAVYGAFDSQISSVLVSRVLAILMCVVIHLLAATAAFHVRRKNRTADTPAGYSDFWIFGQKHKRAARKLQGKTILPS